MKYSQSCILKKQMDVAIERLSRTIAGPGATDAARIRLAVAHVSDIPDWESGACLTPLTEKLGGTGRVCCLHGMGLGCR